jgi:hypothetical protein
VIFTDNAVKDERAGTSGPDFLGVGGAASRVKREMTAGRPGLAQRGTSNPLKTIRWNDTSRRSTMESCGAASCSAIERASIPNGFPFPGWHGVAAICANRKVGLSLNDIKW